MKPIIWSYGGGTQSVAIAVLVAEGKLPRPERIVIADTGREASETWEYMEEYVNPMLQKSVGLGIDIAPHTLATVDLYGGKDGEDLLIPAFTSTGKLPTFCSDKWKKRVVARWMRGEGYGPKNPVRVWIGISVDEVHRAKPSGTRWMEYQWPLLFDAPHRRDECKNVVMRAGLPNPPKSSCWMCPFRQNAQWRRLRDEYPQDWQRAVRFDEMIRQKDPDVFVHHSAVPLAEADIDAGGQGDLFAECDSGFCFV